MSNITADSLFVSRKRGRPPLEDGTPSEVISLRLGPALHHGVQEAAERDGIPVREFIRDAIVRRINVATKSSSR